MLVQGKHVLDHILKVQGCSRELSGVVGLTAMAARQFHPLHDDHIASSACYYANQNVL